MPTFLTFTCERDGCGARFNMRAAIAEREEVEARAAKRGWALYFDGASVAAACPQHWRDGRGPQPLAAVILTARHAVHQALRAIERDEQADAYRMPYGYLVDCVEALDSAHHVARAVDVKLGRDPISEEKTDG